MDEETPALEKEAISPADAQSAQDAFNPQPTPTPTPEPAKAEVKVEDKPADDKPDATKSDKPKSKLDKIGEVKKPEADATKKVEDAKAAVAANPNEKNVKVLREAKEELDRIKPEYEALKGEHTATKEELQKLKALGLTDAERKEFDRYRDLHAVEAVKGSKEFREKIQAPIVATVNEIKDKAIKAGLSATAQTALLNACDIPDKWDRSDEIERILQEAELEPKIYDRLLDLVKTNSTHLQEVLYPKEDAILAKAADIEKAKRDHDQNQTQETTKKQEAEFKQEHEFVYKTLSEQSLKPLFDDTDLSMDGTTMAEALKNSTPADNPRDRAYEVQAAAALPFVIQYANKALAKAHALEEANRQRNGSAPRLGDAASKNAKVDDTYDPQAANTIFKK